jgi:hypothetical protein
MILIKRTGEGPRGEAKNDIRKREIGKVVPWA